ncbi:sensor histidine kinase [Paraburkholderia aromaticivorans]|uniref:sensor histidine kinase n=1 Tax=Paraburkholderia aromaticivorans TaxID=2026199 RepID=UPI0038BA01F1
MQTRRSLRFKVALVFSALTILLLVAQALGVKALAEAQEERLISALIDDDMATLLNSYRQDPRLVPPFDPRLGGHVSPTAHVSVTLPASIGDLSDGTHEIIVNGREIHVAIAPFDDARVYRVYDFNAYERRFKQVIDALMACTGVFALLTIWLAFGLSRLLVRQVAGFVRQVKALRLGESGAINPGRYDETEVVELVDAFNDYHRRMAQMIEREKEFTGNVSHELRTPLTAIRTSCELLGHDEELGAKSRARLRQIDRAASTMSELVNALLLLAREESVADVGPLRLAGAIEHALDPFSERLKAKGVEATIEVDCQLRVEANASALAIVLSNLIDNATRYTDHGRIRLTHIDGWLKIEDTGRGIPADALPYVFDRFYHVDATRSSARGFGIGLSIVKKICDRYGWAIKLDSEPAKGTCVSLRLPSA